MSQRNAAVAAVAATARHGYADAHKNNDDDNDSNKAAAATETTPQQPPPPHASSSTATVAAATLPVQPHSDYYFDSYSHYSIHMEMLKDEHRTTSYRDAMWRNAHLFKGKVVLDVGCGTGILSLFAARAGARKVIAVDCSSVAVQARAIVHDNGLDDVITIVQGKVEDLQLREKVDLIVSEWMGYFLLYESMLNSVLYARDHYGSAHVRLLPSHANMYACGIRDAQYRAEKFDVWDRVHGLDFAYFKRLSFIEPLIDTVHASQIVTNVVAFASFDLATVTVAELAFVRRFALVAQCADAHVDALCVHFDTPFLAGHEAVVLDTSPLLPPTHWRQTVLYLHCPLVMAAGEVAQFRLSCTPNARNPRDLDIALHVDFDGVAQSCHYDQDYRLR